MKRLTLFSGVLILSLSVGCAFGITKNGLYVAAGDSSFQTDDEIVTGGSVSDSFASLLTGLAALIPFANPAPPPAPVINVVLPNTENAAGEDTELE